MTDFFASTVKKVDNMGAPITHDDRYYASKAIEKHALTEHESALFHQMLGLESHRIAAIPIQETGRHGE